jgi:nucleoside-diphosphate-sugar epimerase
MAFPSLSTHTVLITGATGFLGGALTNRLLDEGAKVRALVRSPEKAHYISERGAEIAQGDINDAAAVSRAVEGCTVVFHVAAALGGNLASQVHTNVEGTRAVMQSAADANVRRLVHVSSVSVYGNNYPGDVTEDMTPAPGADPYARTKLQSEQVVREIAARSNTAYSIIRPGMIYGPRSGLWTGQLFRLAKLNPTPFIGDGSGRAHPIFVDDVAEMMVALAAHPAAENETFNAAADPAPTWRQFIQGYSRLAGHQSWLALPVPLFRAFAGIVMLASPRDSIMRDLPDMLTLLLSQTTFKTTKARERLGWSAKVSLEEGIARCAPWLRKKGWLS